MSRLAALLVLTAAFAPAAVMGALPVVAPVLIVLSGVALAVTALERPAPEPVLVDPASDPDRQP